MFITLSLLIIIIKHYMYWRCCIVICFSDSSILLVITVWQFWLYPQFIAITIQICRVIKNYELPYTAKHCLTHKTLSQNTTLIIWLLYSPDSISESSINFSLHSSTDSTCCTNYYSYTDRSQTTAEPVLNSANHNSYN